MDITALANVQNQSEMRQLVSISVLKMAMDVVANQGNAITEIANQVNSLTEMAQALSVDPNLGTNIDITV